MVAVIVQIDGDNRSRRVLCCRFRYSQSAIRPVYKGIVNPVSVIDQLPARVRLHENAADAVIVVCQLWT